MNRQVELGIKRAKLLDRFGLAMLIIYLNRFEYLCQRRSFLAIDFLGKRLDHVIQSHDVNYLTDKD